MINKNLDKTIILSLSKLSTIFLYIQNFQNLKNNIKSLINSPGIEKKIINGTKNELVLIFNNIKLIMSTKLKEIEIEENPLIIKGSSANNHGVCSTKSRN